MMTTILRGQRVEIEIDTSEMNVELFAHAAMRQVQAFAAELEARATYDSRLFRGKVVLRPRPSLALLLALEAPGAFDLCVNDQGFPDGFLASVVRE